MRSLLCGYWEVIRNEEDFNYSVHQPELLQAVLSSITPKSGQKIVTNKVVNDRYWEVIRNEYEIRC